MNAHLALRLPDNTFHHFREPAHEISEQFIKNNVIFRPDVGVSKQ